MNMEEIEALQGLDEFHYKLYDHAIKRHMDYATGIVGIKRRISYQSILEAMYIDPRKGVSDVGYHTKSKIRRGIAALERAGLLVNLQSGCLIFECTLARRDYSVQNKADTKPTHYPDTQAGITKRESKSIQSTTNMFKRFQADTQAGTPKSALADTPPLSDINNILLNINVGSAPQKEPSRFEEFWLQYPRKENKKKSFDIWKRKNLDEIAEEVITDVMERQAKHSAWLKGFIPHATTYLNGERWQDEITMERPSNATNTQSYRPSKAEIFERAMSTTRTEEDDFIPRHH